MTKFTKQEIEGIHAVSLAALKSILLTANKIDHFYHNDKSMVGKTTAEHYAKRASEYAEALILENRRFENVN